jgi:multimeric flavodoxin WrbA
VQRCITYLACATSGLVLLVYWGEMSESAKAFIDRLRGCEAARSEDSGLFLKPVIAAAATVGSGSARITGLASMEGWIEHARARRFALITVNRWSWAYKVVTLRSADGAMVKEMKGG